MLLISVVYKLASAPLYLLLIPWLHEEPHFTTFSFTSTNGLINIRNLYHNCLKKEELIWQPGNRGINLWWAFLSVFPYSLLSIYILCHPSFYYVCFFLPSTLSISSLIVSSAYFPSFYSPHPSPLSLLSSPFFSLPASPSSCHFLPVSFHSLVLTLPSFPPSPSFLPPFFQSLLLSSPLFSLQSLCLSPPLSVIFPPF